MNLNESMNKESIIKEIINEVSNSIDESDKKEGVINKNSTLNLKKKVKGSIIKAKNVKKGVKANTENAE